MKRPSFDPLPNDASYEDIRQRAENVDRWVHWVYETSMRAEKLYDERQYDEAIEVLEHLMDGESGTPLTYNYLANIYEERGQWDDVVRVLRAGFEHMNVHPRMAERWLQRIDNARAKIAG